MVSFSTPRLAIERAHGNLIGNEPLNITFNQEVDIDVARELAFHPHIRGSFDYGTRVEWRGEKQIHTTDTSILTFTPSRPWTPSTTYTIILKS